MISFFRRHGGSGEIRATQISEWLGARVNPRVGYEDDVCIYVKMQPPDSYPVNSYLDIIDGEERVSWLLKHPDIGVIASSLSGKDYLTKKLQRDDIIYIPQHHCNFEREHRLDQPAVTVGVVGGDSAIMCPELYDRMNILHITSYRNRIDVVNAYKMLDIQIIWRYTKNPMKNALKIINAASFGIPTVAYPSDSYQEMAGYYYPVLSVDEMVEQVENLKQNGWDAQRLIDKAEAYHIANISKLYGELLQCS